MSTQNSFAACTTLALFNPDKLTINSASLDSSYTKGHPAKLVFIDSQVDNYKSLLNNLQEGYKAYVLSAERNGIEQITKILSKFKTVEAIHLVSHGEPGVLRLGATQLNARTIHQYQAQWEKWTSVLSNEAQLLLYGCCVAQGEASMAFIQTLSELTGAAIAASANLIGNTNKANNWNLNVQTRPFKPALAFKPEALASYQFTLNTNQTSSSISPIRVEAESYRSGTNGVEYYDTSAGNAGNASQFTDDVDVETTTDTSGDFHVAFIKNNEFLSYDVNVPAAGQYDLVFRVATNRSSKRKIEVNVGGQTYTATFVAAPGGFTGWQDVILSGVTLGAGTQTIQTDFVRGFFNFNYFDIVPAGTITTNTAPTTSGINNVMVTEGTPDTVVGLFDAFTDAESHDAELTYAITTNTNTGLFEATTIDPITGELTLDYTATGTGFSNITVSAADPEGLSQSTTFAVTVGDNGGGSVTPGNAIRVEAEDYRSGTNGVEYSDTSAGNVGNASQFTDDVDVETTTDTSGDFHVAFIKNNEFLSYDVNVPAAGQYDLVFRVATNRSNKRRIEVNVGGQTYTATFVAAPGGFTGWQDVILSDVTLGAGTQTIQTDFVRGFFNFNYFDIIPAGSTVSNTAPTTAGIPDITVVEGAGNTIIDLFEVFDDAQSVDTALGFTLTSNTNPALFDSVTLDSIPGVLTLDYTATGTGSSEITIEAQDPEGLTVSTSFTVNVGEPVVSGSAIRIEAENYRSGNNGADYFDSTTGNKGNASQFTDDVDVQATSDTSGDFHVGFIANNEFLSYDVNIPAAGQYDLVFRVATNRSNKRKLDITVGGDTYRAEFVAAPGGFDGWQNVTISDVTLGAGIQTIQTDFVQAAFNFNYFDIVPTGAGTTNTAPTANGISDIVVVEGAGNTVVSLFDAFDDAQSTDTELTYAVTGNTNLGLFDAIAIHPTNGELTLDYAAIGTGTSELTIEATDADGIKESTDFVVSVTAPSTSDGIIRINAGGDSVYDPDGNLWQADTFFSGGQTFAELGQPITNADDNFRFDSLYQSQRIGNNFSYAVPLDNGSYRINLHLSELVFSTNDQRLFDVSIENEQVFNNLDIFAKTKNAFLDGKDTSRILQLEEELPPPGDVISVEDGSFNINFSASLQDAAIAGIEIIPITTPQVVIKPSDNSTTVSEGGAADTYTIVLSTQPTSDVTININAGSELSTDVTSVTFNASNWFQSQTVTIEAIDDTQAEGLQTANISHTINSSDPTYQGLSVPDIEATVSDNDQASPISFTVKDIPTINLPTRAAWGPDGRLYVTSLRGEIAAYEFNGDYNIVSTQTINTIAPLANHEILGIAFNPFDTEPKIYVAHSHLEANGGDAFPVTEFSPYSGQISVLEGPNFSTLTPLITGLPVSNHDHGVNGLEFDNDGNLYIAVGGNTNAGIVSEAIGGIDESPFTSAILKAEITKPNFNGNIEYTLSNSFVNTFLQENNLTLSDFVLEDGTTQFDLADSQAFGYVAEVAPGVDVSVYASGTRNPFDLVHTTQGKLYATDNGANFNAGSASTGANSEAPLGGKQFDELNLIVEDAYYGSPNRSRGLTDARQNVFYGTNNPYEQSIPGIFTEPIGLFGKNSTNGIDEYRATTFGGQLKGNLISHQYNSKVWNVALSPDGTAVESIVDLNEINGTAVAEGLDVLTGMGGAILGVDIQGNRLTVAIPNDPNATGPAAWDIFPYRAPAIGGSDFIIGGVNFDTTDTQVFIGSQEITGLGVTENRIAGVIPDLLSQSNQLLDVRVISSGIESIIPDAFQTLA